MDAPKVGDVRWMVFYGSDDRPWVGRLQCEFISKAGRSVHWRLMDSVGKEVRKLGPNSFPLSKTPLEALHAEQLRQVQCGSVFDSVERARKRLHLILTIEKMIKERSERLIDRAISNPRRELNPAVAFESN